MWKVVEVTLVAPEGALQPTQEEIAESRAEMAARLEADSKRLLLDILGVPWPEPTTLRAGIWGTDPNARVGYSAAAFVNMTVL